jgi:8-oxo-dGTP pyrophosphatase MutT (NUDIX family)
MAISEYLRQLRKKVGSELILTPSVAILTFDEQDRVLLVRQRENRIWGTPGGSIDPFETPADAAVREMWEETGLYVEPIRILGAYGGNENFHWQYNNGDEVIYVTIAFEAKVIGGELKPQDREILELRYFSQDEIELLDTHDWVKMILNDAFRHRDFTNFDPPTWSPPTAEN